ncbi:MAG TPA: hypothetical protein V6C86_15950 [Oculatellaceae cyanobacterium]
MTEGVLIINLEPAYIRFSPSARSKIQISSPTPLHCSVEHIREVLIELDAITPEQDLPRDCFMRIPIKLSAAILRKFLSNS